MSSKGTDIVPEGLLTTDAGVRIVQEEIRKAGLDGWLLYDFKDRNPIARSLLGIKWTTRRAFILIPAEGDPRVLVHAIERTSWTHLPWALDMYAGWQEMHGQIAELLRGCKVVATETSPRGSVPYLDLLPAGIAELISDTGVELKSSGDLVSTFYAKWTSRQYEDHIVASKIVKAVASEAFERAAKAVQDGVGITEGDLALWIKEELASRGAGTQADTIVAIGPMAADPHYFPGEVGQPIQRGDVLLIDLWGGLSPESAPADQTWMGYMGSSLPSRVEELWETIRRARDASVVFLEERFKQGHVIRGFEVDDVARRVISEAGFGEYFIHRTGHSIDRDLHGRGPNLDNLEAQDDRILVPGVGFSIEPGIYIAGDVGLRTEINVFMGENGPEVTVEGRQMDVFLLLED